MVEEDDGHPSDVHETSTRRREVSLFSFRVTNKSGDLHLMTTPRVEPLNIIGRAKSDGSNDSSPALDLNIQQNKDQRICSDHSRQNVHAREFKLRLGFSSYDEQVTRNWHRQ